MPRSKRYVELAKLIDPKKLYSLTDAIELVKKTGTTKFDSTIEVHASLGIDIKKSDQQVRYTVVMPHAAGKVKTIYAFVPADKEKEALEAGAEVAGSEELIEKIATSGKTDFDIAVATPDMMPKIAKLAKILGPKGLMPNPKTETVSANVKKMIEELKKGKVTVKNDSTGNIHQAIGKASNNSKDLVENLEAVIGAIRKAKPGSAKGTYLKTVVIKSTMGPAIHVDSSGV